MKCSEIEERLTAYLENFLPNEEKTMIEQHCARCSRCRDALKDLERTKNILENLHEVEPPAWLADRVMTRITEAEERKGWIKRFFLPLHVKVPVEALAMALVVVLSVYVYRSTTPEPGDLARLEPRTQTAGNLDTSAKKEAGTKKKIDEAPRPDAQGPESKKAEARKAPVQSMPAVPEITPASPKSAASTNEADASRAPDAARKDPGGQAITKEPPAPAASAPYPEKAQRFKTRSATPMAAREEKASEYKMAGPETPRDTPWQIIVTSADPSGVVRETRRILLALSAKEIRERAENNSIIISGVIDPIRVSELKDKMAEVAEVHEVRKGTGRSQTGPVEIIVLKDP
jgi:hypothetical protein